MIIDSPYWVKHGGEHVLCKGRHLLALSSRPQQQQTERSRAQPPCSPGSIHLLPCLAALACCACPDGDGISGLDVSPNGRRLATCGSAPQIVIWNMLPILDERAEQDASVPKILATIQDSSGSVLTVRFSHCGSMLAAGCGGDADSAVLIFKQSSIPATQTLGMGGSKLPNIENWRPVATLRGHSLDVTALSWSPGDEFLASASMDGNVHIWGMNPGGWCCW